MEELAAKAGEEIETNIMRRGSIWGRLETAEVVTLEH